MRKVLQTSSVSSEGKHPNPPIYFYDTSGPYSDPEVSMNVESGLPKQRNAWLKLKSLLVQIARKCLAKQGVVTEEMEFIAIRENQCREKNERLRKGTYHKGESFGANHRT